MYRSTELLLPGNIKIYYSIELGYIREILE